MKKFLSIILSLILIITTVFTVPAFSVSAAEVTASSFTDGVVWGLSEGGADYLKLTSGWGSFTGANGSVTFTDPNSCRSVMANVKGFTAGKSYQVSFSSTGIYAVYVVLNYDSAYFDTDQLVKAKSGFESDVVSGTVTNGIATVNFTPTSDNIYLIVKSNSSSGTLNNFSVETISELESIVNKMNNGLTWGLSEGGADYLRLTSGWGSFTSANGSVTFTDPNSCRSVMANVKGFNAGQAYSLSFNATGIVAVYAVLNYDSAFFNSDQNLQAKEGFESDVVRGTVSNGVANIKFTPTTDSIYIVVKSGAGTGTLNNFDIKLSTEEDDNVDGDENANTGIAGGVWKVTNGSVTTTADSVILTGLQYHSAYTTLNNLIPNTIYELSFDVNTAINCQLWMLSGNETLTFNDSIPNGATCLQTINGTKFNVTFTTESSSSYHLILRNIAATSNYTFSNFKLTAIETMEEDKLLGNKIADGTWSVTGSGAVTNDTSLHTVKADTTWHCAYTTVTGLKPNTKYRFSCNFDAEGLSTIYLVNSTLEAPVFNDSVYSGNCSDIAQNINIADKTASFTFVTNEFDSKYTLIFKHDELTNGAVTYSDFSVENLGEYSVVDSISEFQNSDWQCSAGNIIKNDDGTVTAQTPWHFAYTKLPLLPRDSLVKIEMNFTRTGNNIEQLYIVSADEEFKVNQSTGGYAGSQQNIANYSVENDKITAYFKTSTGRSGYYLGIKHGAISNSGVTYSNFNIEIINNASSVASTVWGNNVLDSDDWVLQYTSNGKVTHNKTAHTLTQSGNSYQDIATTLSGLQPNTTYAISVSYTENDNVGGMYVYPTTSDKWAFTSNIGRVTNDTANRKITVTFDTTSDASDYYLHLRHGVLENGDITYSNMQIKAEKLVFEEEIRGAKIADGEWSAEIPGNVKYVHNYATHSLTQTVNGYQRIFTKVDFLEPNTEYEFTANYTTGDTIQGVYVAPAEQELDFSIIDQYSVSYSKSNGVLNFSFMASATCTEYYIIIYHGELSDNEITYTDFRLRADKVWSNEEQGALLTENEWKTTSTTANVTVDKDAKTVTTNATSNYIYVQLTGLSLNTSYRITCSYTGKDSDVSAVYIGRSENFPFNNSSTDRHYNKATSSSFKNNYLTVNFKTTGSNSNYWLAIKQSGSLSAGSITYSNFKFSIPGVTTVNDEFSEWTSPSSSASYSIAENSVTASATSGSIYTKISGLEHNTTYNLQVNHSNLNGIKQFKVIPASESLTRSTYWSNGYYNGKYVNYVYSTTAHNSQNGTTNIVFTTDDTYSSYYLIVELKNGTSVTLSNWSLNEFTDLGFEGTAVRKAEPYVRQALRYKNTISAEAFNNGCFGLELKEFGSIVADTKDLNGLPLILNENQKVGNALVKKGVAYNSTTSKIYETLSDGTKVFTAALINIASEKYSVDYTVRPYIILTDGQNDYIVYGAEQVYSIFTVFELIEIYGKGEDNLIVYDILDKKPAVNTEYYKFKGLSTTNTTNLSVYNNTVLSNDYKGLNGTVYHSSGYITNDITGRNYTDEQRETELKRLSESGVKYCRTRFTPTNVWANGKFNFYSSRMQDFVNYCRALQSKNISVCMQTNWYLTEILENVKNNGVSTYLNGNGADLYSEQALYSGLIANEYKLTGSQKMLSGETMTDYYNRIGIAAVRYGVYLSNVIKAAKDQGVNNIDYLIYFTEPSYATESKPEGDYANEYLFVCKTIKNVIERIGYANGVKHVGPNQGSVQTGVGLLKYVVTREPDLFDVLTSHFYPYSTYISDDEYYKQCVNAFASYLQVLKDAGVENKEFWVDEFFAVQKNSSRIARQSAMAALQTIVGSIAAQQLGVENIVLWQIFDQAWGDTNETSAEFENGIHMCGTCPSLLVSDVPYDAYYPLSTFMRFNSATSGKSFATSSGKNATAQGVYIGAMQDDNGNTIITVVNIGSSEKIINLNLEKALGKNLYRYSVCEEGINPTADATPTECSRIIQNVGTSFKDTILPYSVSVYTTAAK